MIHGLGKETRFASKFSRPSFQACKAGKLAERQEEYLASEISIVQKKGVRRRLANVLQDTGTSVTVVISFLSLARFHEISEIQ